MMNVVVLFTKLLYYCTEIHSILHLDRQGYSEEPLLRMRIMSTELLRIYGMERSKAVSSII